MSSCPPPEKFVFYDLETFGIHASSDRICQFAAIKTDAELNEIDRTLLYCKPPEDYLPSVSAMLVTGLTPFDSEIRNGLTEAAFIKKIFEFFECDGVSFNDGSSVCIVGYNNIRFDDEFIRRAAYRNFYNPYSFNAGGSRSRWDIFNLVKLCYALTPDGFDWPMRKPDETAMPNSEQDPEAETTFASDRPSLCLSDLTLDNNLPHGRTFDCSQRDPHDAMADVVATIAVARKIRHVQPKMFEYCLSMRRKNDILESLLEGGTMKFEPLIFIGPGMDPSNRSAGVFMPVKMDAIGSLYCVRLDRPFGNDIFDTHPDDVDFDETSLTSLKLLKVKMSACPLLYTAKLLNKDNRAEKLGIDRELVARNAAFVREKIFSGELLPIVDKFAEAYGRYWDDKFPTPLNPEMRIYARTNLSREESNQDRAVMNWLHTEEESNPDVLNRVTFNDDNLNKMVFAYKARNYPQMLTREELSIWQSRISEYAADNKDRFINELQEAWKKYPKEKAPETAALIEKIAKGYGLYDHSM